MREEQRLLLTEKFQSILRRNERSIKTQLEYQSDNCYRQDPVMNPEISDLSFKQKQDVCIVYQFLPKYLVLTKEKQQLYSGEPW